MSHHDKPFYGTNILRDQEAAYIKSLLKKYKKMPADETLKKTIWDELQKEKTAGNIKIPFKVVLTKDPTNKFPPAVEVLLDSKV